jgi:hypothetical protein
MALVQLSDFLDLIPAMLQAPHRSMHCTYDETVPFDLSEMKAALQRHLQTR